MRGRHEPLRSPVTSEPFDLGAVYGNKNRGSTRTLLYVYVTGINSLSVVGRPAGTVSLVGRCTGKNFCCVVGVVRSRSVAGSLR